MQFAQFTLHSNQPQLIDSVKTHRLAVSMIRTSIQGKGIIQVQLSIASRVNLFISHNLTKNSIESMPTFE